MEELRNKLRYCLENESYEVYEKVDGCFLYSTKVNCWDGSTIKIGDIVNNKVNIAKLQLIGMDRNGNLVPCKVTNTFNNGIKNNWIELTLDCPISKKSGSGGNLNKLKVTKNHHVFLNGKYINAENLKIGDTLTNYEEVLDENLLKIVRAGLLGDGWLGNRYSEAHKIQHEEYIDYLYKITSNFGIKKDYRISGFGSKMVRFNSKVLKSLEIERKLWYIGGKKVVPEDISWFDDFVVAKWYMDDGSLNHHSDQTDRANFATNGFTEADVNRLAQKLQDMYGVSTTVYYSKGWAIRVNSGKNNEINKMWRRISKYIIPCLKYKLPIKFRDESFILPKIGKTKLIIKKIKILNIKELKNDKKTFPSGRTGYDIETTTHNYMINGVLVHNSLGILYKDPADNRYKIATRGSFKSDQAKKATEIFNNVPQYEFSSYSERYQQLINMHPEYADYTLLFEIIYPENRINDGARLVCDYGSTETLILLGAVNKITSKDANYKQLEVISEYISLPLVKKLDYTIQELLEMKSTLPATEEGWVVRFESGFRIKIKGDQYCIMQKILNGVTALNIWDMMKESDEISGRFEVPFTYKLQVPEEILAEVDELERRLKDLSARVRMEIVLEYKQAFDYAVDKYPDHIEKGLGMFAKESIDLKHKSAIFLYHKQNLTALHKYINMNIRPRANHIGD